MEFYTKYVLATSLLEIEYRKNSPYSKSIFPIFSNLEFVQIFNNDELVAYTREVRHIPVYYKFVSLLLITSEITLLTAIIVFVNKVIFFDLAHFQKKKKKR